jgi:hypothetical protein
VGTPPAAKMAANGNTRIAEIASAEDIGRSMLDNV